MSGHGGGHGGHGPHLHDLEEEAEKAYKSLFVPKEGKEFSLADVHKKVQDITRLEKEEERHKETLTFLSALQTYNDDFNAHLEAKIFETLNKDKSEKEAKLQRLVESFKEKGVSPTGGKGLSGGSAISAENYVGALFGLMFFGAKWYETAMEKLTKESDSTDVEHALAVFTQVYLGPAAAKQKKKPEDLLGQIMGLIKSGKITREAASGQQNAWDLIQESIVTGYSTGTQNKIIKKLVGANPEYHSKLLEYILSSPDLNEKKFDKSDVYGVPVDQVASLYVSGADAFHNAFPKKEKDKIDTVKY
jgi:hypothetical protein